MHGQYDWTGDPALSSQQLRMGHRVPGRPVAAFAQLHAPHLHQHRRHGPRHRLRHPADERGPALAAVLPGQPGLRVPADGAVPVRRRAARAGDRAHRVRRDHARRQARDPRGHLAQDQAADAQGLRGVPAAGRTVRAVGVRRQPDRQPDPQRLVIHDHLLRPLPRGHPGVPDRGDQGRDPRHVVLPPGARLGKPDRRQAVSHPERQPVVPDRAPPVPRHPGAPPRRDLRRGARDLRALRRALQHAARCSSSSAPSCARSSGWRCPSSPPRKASPRR